MANILAQIGQRNVVRVVSQGVPSSLEGLTDTDLTSLQKGAVLVWNGEQFTNIVDDCQISVSGCILTVDPVSQSTAFTDTISGGFF